MKPEDPLPIHPTMLLSKHMVYDAIYKPAETALLKEAKNLGAETSNGLSMLLHQGVLAFKYWFPRELPTTEMYEGLKSSL